MPVREIAAQSANRNLLRIDAGGHDHPPAVDPDLAIFQVDRARRGDDRVALRPKPRGALGNSQGGQEKSKNENPHDAPVPYFESLSRSAPLRTGGSQVYAWVAGKHCA